jgi:hypothetical protein
MAGAISAEPWGHFSGVVEAPAVFYADGFYDDGEDLPYTILRRTRGSVS